MSLVDVADLRQFLGLQDEDDGDDILQKFLDQAEEQFLRAANRIERPFQPAQSNRSEVKDGTGGRYLFLDYPIGALTTAITLGYQSPWDESLDPTDVTVIQFAVGSRRVARVDGGRFGYLGRPGYVRVTYNAQADLPSDARLAILRRAAANYRESGEPRAIADRATEDQVDLPLSAAPDPMWDQAVRDHLEPRI